MSSRFETQKNRISSPHEFDLDRGFLGPNLKLIKQLSAGELKAFDESGILLATWFPHSSLGLEGIIATGEIYVNSYRAFGLERIYRIAQVGAVAFLPEELHPFFRDAKQSRAIGSNTRWQHCLTTGIILELMLRNNHFEEKDIATGVIGGLLHDAAITPFSDMVSGLDPKRLDEAENLPLYLERLDRKKKENFDRKYSPDYARIFEVVKGRGDSLGTLLKIADRLAYTAYDSAFLAYSLEFNRKMSSGSDGNPLEEVADIFRENPKLFDVFREVRLDSQNSDAYFEDPHTMALFLRVRALMYAHFYLNPQRLNFQTVGRRMIKDLMDKNELKTDDFLRMTDSDIIAILFASPFALNYYDAYEKIGFVKGKNRDELRKGLKAKGISSSSIIWADKITGFDTLTDWLVRNPKDGKIEPFSRVCPKETAELEGLSRQTKGVVVYFEKES